MVLCFGDSLPVTSPHLNTAELTVMFVLAEMQDTVRIQPHRFSRDMGQELSDELNKKFANKVKESPFMIMKI